MSLCCVACDDHLWIPAKRREERLPARKCHQRQGALLNVLFLFHRRTIWFPTGRTASSPLGKRQKNLIAAIPEQSCIKQSREEQRVALNFPGSLLYAR